MMRRIAFAVAATLACTASTTSPTPSSGYLVVRNAGAFDAVVYVVREPGTTGVRIGSVTANTTKRLALQRGHIPLSDAIALAVHPIGTNTTWTSASVMLQPKTVPVLDLRIGAGGDCLACALYIVSNAAALRIVGRGDASFDKSRMVRYYDSHGTTNQRPQPERAERPGA